MMKINFVSSYVLNNSRRPLMAQAQKDIMQASYESTTGRVYDPGLKLGHSTGRFINNESQTSYLSGLMDTNALLGQRMSASQKALGSLVSVKDQNGNGMDGALTIYNRDLAGYPSVATPEILQNSARSALHSVMSALNTNYNGEYVFGGTNTQEPPLKPYEEGQAVVQEAFRNHFGFSPDDKEQVAGITAEAMQDFIDGPFSDLFSEEGWKKNFSNAADAVPQNVISPGGEMVDTGISANGKGFRDAMKNLMLVAEFGNIDGLSGEAQAALVERTYVGEDGTMSGSAVTRIIADSSRLGSAEGQVQKANERMNLQMTVLNATRNEMIGVDQAEAVERVMQSMTMLNISYSLTAQISRMSLVNYL